ncbi:hypothetical protein R3P38DRAFT_3205974 [Favolaschia claudopus]|uniref:Uncharacterized protein n=1 Tax=Favolaschia claudopus TaxID=2862362 RepID=A0AAW0ANW7_9AGAR
MDVMLVLALASAWTYVAYSIYTLSPQEGAFRGYTIFQIWLYPVILHRACRSSYETCTDFSLHPLYHTLRLSTFDSGSVVSEIAATHDDFPFPPLLGGGGPRRCGKFDSNEITPYLVDRIKLSTYEGGTFSFEVQVPVAKTEEVLGKHPKFVAATLPFSKVSSKLTRQEGLGVAKLHNIPVRQSSSAAALRLALEQHNCECVDVMTILRFHEKTSSSQGEPKKLAPANPKSKIATNAPPMELWSKALRSRVSEDNRKIANRFRFQRKAATNTLKRCT